MADQRLRELERRARAGDQDAASRLEALEARTGALLARLIEQRDPRVDPHAGDVVDAPQYGTRRREKPHIVRRIVAFVWGDDMPELTGRISFVVPGHGDYECSPTTWRKWAAKGEVIRHADGPKLVGYDRSRGATCWQCLKPSEECSSNCPGRKSGPLGVPIREATS